MKCSHVITGRHNRDKLLTHLKNKVFGHGFSDDLAEALTESVAPGRKLKKERKEELAKVAKSYFEKGAKAQVQKPVKMQVQKPVKKSTKKRR